MSEVNPEEATRCPQTWESGLILRPIRMQWNIFMQRFELVSLLKTTFYKCVVPRDGVGQTTVTTIEAINYIGQRVKHQSADYSLDHCQKPCKTFPENARLQRFEECQRDIKRQEGRVESIYFSVEILWFYRSAIYYIFWASIFLSTKQGKYVCFIEL